VIDLQKNQGQAKFLKRSLAKFGLPTDFASAIALLASTIRDHKHLGNVLTGMSPEERQMTYDSVRPHLKFVAWPLDKYISSVGERAEREQWATVDEAGQFKPFKPGSIEADGQKLVGHLTAKESLTLTCSKCAATEPFFRVGEETRVDAVIKARKAGWLYLAATDSEMCPKCVEKEFSRSQRN
jgi:hypothetical protein